MAAAVADHQRLSPSLINPTSKTVLQRYQLGKVLGKGSSGYAKVFHARSLMTSNRSVAIKVIDKSETHPSMRVRIVSEVAAMQRLEHPNILKIHEVLATKSKIYLVMELAKGSDLSRKLARRPDHRFTEPIARKYFHQLVSAIHYCHQKGVIHGGVKLQNLLLDEDSNIKVAGFGHCAIADDVTDNIMLKTVCGTTPAFTAPEIVGRTMTNEYDGAKADVWSCGVILFVMLTGYLPFDDSNFVTMLRKMRMREIYFPSWVTKPVKGLVTRLLDPNPNSRMTMDEVVCDAWLKNICLSYHRRIGPISLGDYPSLEKRMCEKLLFERSSNKVLDAIMRTTTDSTMDSSGGGSSGARMNAFEIIMMSSGFNLDGLCSFCGQDEMRRPKRFIMNESKKLVVEKVMEIGMNLGYEVEKSKNCKGSSCFVWLGKGRFIVLVTVSEVVVELTMVEMEVVSGAGVGWDQEKAYWNELMNGLNW